MMRSVIRYPLGPTGAGLGKLFAFGGLRTWALIVFMHIATRKIEDSRGSISLKTIGEALTFLEFD